MIKEMDFACPCCGANQISSQLVSLIQSLEHHIGEDLTITSGFRCPKHNKEVGGSPTSSHLKGLAVDIAAADLHLYFSIIYWSIFLGITRMGLGKNFIHLDIDPGKTQEVVWRY